ncbi:U3 small nucleolar RNA-associated protein 13 [Entomophthora muscae]|uniref:U3 small nucleolar RNA-associated protein 13 n=1 Tax=Entomophthora muscae TaxID=34485 RepID=A0ACC2USB1_9FUNG|nr:U3 small nucleolar RNA-associated protein 13 [Entomophthora muscae]
MASTELKQSFKLEKTIESVYTGGKVCVSRDLTKIFTTLGEDILVTDYTTGQKLAELKGESDIITAFAVKPDGRHLVAASRSLIIKVWELENYTLVRSFKAHEAPVLTMEIDESSTLVATGSADSTVKVWDIDGGFATHNFRGHGGVISALKFFRPEKSKSANQIWLASGSADCTVRVWDLATSKCRGAMESHTSVIRGLDFSVDGKLLISGSRDKVANIWSTKDYKLIKSIPVYEALESVGFVCHGTLDSLIEHADSRTLFYTGGETGLLKIWDVKTGKPVHEQKKTAKVHPLTELLYIGQHHLFVTITHDHNIIFFSGKENLRLIKQVVGHTEEIVDLKYVGSEEYLAVASNSEQIRLYNTETQNCTIIDGHTDMVVCLASRTADGLLASGSKDHTARVWKVDVVSQPPTVQCLAICSGHAEAVSTLALSCRLDYRTLLVTGSQDRTIKMWDLTLAADDSSLKSIYTFQAHDKEINTVSFSPSDRFFATGSHDKTAKLWNTEDGSLVGTFKGHKRGVWSVMFSPTEPLLATASGDKTIKLWNVSDLTCVKTFEGHTNSVLSVLFLSGGRQLMSSGSDGLVKLWDIKTNQCSSTLDNHTEKVWALTNTPDETRVVSGAADATISFWKDHTQEENDLRREETEERILKEQELANRLHAKDYVGAFRLCLALQHPGKLLHLLGVIAESRAQDDKSVTGDPRVDDIFATMDMERVKQVLEYIKVWNTNGRHAHLAQNVLHLILRHKDASDLNEVPGVKEILTALIPYTQRHYAKLDQLITQSFLIDYTLEAMDQA